MKLTIPTPCHENWNKMTPLDQGRFCGSCQKQVVDFTSMSDAQLIAFFRKPSRGSVCGRLMPGQMDRDIDIPRKRIPWVKYVFQFAIPALLVSSKAAAQGEIKALKKDTVAVSRTVILGQMTRATLPSRVITGRVLDDDENRIPGIRVSIDGTDVSVMTDSSGYFKIEYTGLENRISILCWGDKFNEVRKLIKLGKKLNKTRYVELTLSRKPEDEIVVVGLMAVNWKRRDKEI